MLPCLSVYSCPFYGVTPERYQATDNQKALQLLQKISPVAWRHIHLLGRYMFRDRGQPIDLDALLADITLA